MLRGKSRSGGLHVECAGGGNQRRELGTSHRVGMWPVEWRCGAAHGLRFNLPDGGLRGRRTGPVPVPTSILRFRLFFSGAGRTIPRSFGRLGVLRRIHPSQNLRKLRLTVMRDRLQATLSLLLGRAGLKGWRAPKGVRTQSKSIADGTRGGSSGRREWFGSNCRFHTYRED